MENAITDNMFLNKILKSITDPVKEVIDNICDRYFVQKTLKCLLKVLFIDNVIINFINDNMKIRFCLSVNKILHRKSYYLYHFLRKMLLSIISPIEKFPSRII